MADLSINVSTTEFSLRPANPAVGGAKDAPKPPRHLDHTVCRQPGPSFGYRESPKHIRIQQMPKQDPERYFCCPTDPEIAELPPTEPVLGQIPIEQNREWKTVLKGLLQLKEAVDGLNKTLHRLPQPTIPDFRVSPGERNTFNSHMKAMPKQGQQCMIKPAMLAYEEHDTRLCVCSDRLALVNAWNRVVGSYSFPCNHICFVKMYQIYQDIWKILMQTSYFYIEGWASKLPEKIDEVIKFFTAAGVIPGLVKSEYYDPVDLSMHQCKGCQLGDEQQAGN